MSINYKKINNIINNSKQNLEIDGNYLLDLVEYLDSLSNDLLWKIRRDPALKETKRYIGLILNYRKDVSSLDSVDYLKTLTTVQLLKELKSTYAMGWNEQGEYPEDYVVLIKKELELRPHIEKNKVNRKAERKGKIPRQLTKAEKKEKKIKKDIIKLKSKGLSVSGISDKLNIEKKVVLAYYIELGFEDFIFKPSFWDDCHPGYEKPSEIDVKYKLSEGLYSARFGFNKHKLDSWEFNKEKKEREIALLKKYGFKLKCE